MISAYSAVIDHNIPCPQSYGVPLTTKSQRMRVKEFGQRRNTFFTSNLFLPSATDSVAPALETFIDDFGVLTGAEGPASGISTSAMMKTKDSSFR